MLDFVIFAVTFLAVLLAAIIWLYPSSKRVTTIPGLDPASKDDGNLGDIERAGSLHEFLVDLHDRFGPISGFWWSKTYVVSLASPELFKEHAKVFDRPPELFKVFEPIWGSSALQYANGTDGRNRRKHYDRILAHDHLHMYYDTIQKVANKFEKKWMKKGEHDHIPATEEMNAYALEVALLCLLGENFNDEKLVLSFKNAYDKTWAEMEHRLADPVIPTDDSPRMKQFNEALKYIKSSIKKVVEHRKQHNLHKDGNLLVDVIIETATSEEMLISDVILYLIGGFHTTGNVLTWAMYFLATHKDVQTKLYKEIIQVLGDESHVTQSSFGHLKYTRQVIDETLRCATVAPWAARFQDFDSELGGHKVPKNTPVLHALGVVLQDETLWPLPNKFDPDRFNVEQSKNRPTYAFAPFGFAGKRICPGHNFAYLESTILLATIIRRFEVHMCDDQLAVPVYGLVTHPQEEVWIKVTKRK